MNKNILLVLMLGIFLISFASAVSIDYAKGQNGNNDLKVDFSNRFLGLDFLWKTSEIGTAELKSHKFITEVLKVGLGKQVTMYYDFNFKELYRDELGEVTFKNMRTGELVQRDYHYVYWGTENYNESVYSCSNTTSGNGSITSDCIQTGTKTLTRGKWFPYNSKDIPKGQMRIGIEVEVLMDDYIDGVWTIVGKKIDKHAEWDAVGKTYYKTSIPSASYPDTSNLEFTDGILPPAAMSNAGWFGFDTNILGVTQINITIDSGVNSKEIYNITLRSLTSTPSGVYLPTTTAWGSNDNTTFINLGTLTWDGADAIFDTVRMANLATSSNYRYVRYNMVKNGQWIFVGEGGINWTGLAITSISPVDNYNSTSSSINFDCNATDETGVYSLNLTINDTVYETVTGAGTTDLSLSSTETLTDGYWEWYCTGNDAEETKNSTMRSLFIDATLPVINISHPTDGQNFPYLTNLQNITLNTTITDTNLDTCWYEYNSTNTTFPCSTGVLSENNLTINNKSIVTVWANDTVGNTNSSTLDWTFTLFDFNEYIFDSSITETSSTTFYGYFQTGSSISSTKLEYNNTNYTVSINSLGGNKYNLSKTVTSPMVSSNNNIAWFFWVNKINATSQNQTVINVQLDNCSSYTNYIINYKLLDELTQSEINNVNSSIESEVYLKTLSGNEVTLFNQTFTGNSTPSICSQENLNTSGLRLWQQTRYGSTDYVYEQNNIQNRTMTSLPIEINLRDLPSDSATTFRIKYRSETFLPISDVVIKIQRKYIGEGVYKESESLLTDTNGEVSANLDLDSVIYRILVKQNGSTLSTFENPAIACDNILTGDCSINLNERSSVSLISRIDTLNDFSYGLTQDNRTITLTFDIPSGESKLVNLYVNQSSILGNKTACNQTLLATSGQLQCEVTDTLGDVYADVIIYSDGESIRKSSTIINEDRSGYFGTNNIILTFFLILSLVLLMISDPITVLVGLFLGVLSSSLMYLLNAGTPFGIIPAITYLIIVLVLLIIKISNKQNR